MTGNPFRPGAGHPPPHLAGRLSEKSDFDKLLKQDTLLTNAVVTGLRGVGKTVLLNELKPLALKSGWAWVGSDLSESVSVSEENLAIRLLTDLAVYSSNIPYWIEEKRGAGFHAKTETDVQTLNYATLINLYNQTPGLVADKIKSVFRFVAKGLPEGERIIFAYDEAQNLADNAAKEQFPLSNLLDVFQAIQREGIPFMLVLAGLPTLFPKLVEARTFAERMFSVIFLDRLSDSESREAIEIPLNKSTIELQLTDPSITAICNASCGYPYFIQYLCREAYDIWEVAPERSIPIDELLRKLDTDFFAGRWARASDRQRELMATIAALETADAEFTVQEIVAASDGLPKPFTSSHVNQMLLALSNRGLIYKNRHGKYSFAVPLFHDFIGRQIIHT